MTIKFYFILCCFMCICYILKNHVHIHFMSSLWFMLLQKAIHILVSTEWSLMKVYNNLLKFHFMFIVSFGLFNLESRCVESMVPTFSTGSPVKGEWFVIILYTVRAWQIGYSLEIYNMILISHKESYVCPSSLHNCANIRTHWLFVSYTQESKKWLTFFSILQFKT